MTALTVAALAAIVIALVVRDRRREVAMRGKDVVIAQQAATIMRHRHPQPTDDGALDALAFAEAARADWDRPGGWG